MQYIRMILFVSALALPGVASAFTVDSGASNNPDAVSNLTDPDDQQSGGLGVHYNMAGSNQPSDNSQGGLSLYQGGAEPGTLPGMTGQPCSWSNPCDSRAR